MTTDSPAPDNGTTPARLRQVERVADILDQRVSADPDGSRAALTDSLRRIVAGSPTDDDTSTRRTLALLEGSSLTNGAVEDARPVVGVFAVAAILDSVAAVLDSAQTPPRVPDPPGDPAAHAVRLRSRRGVTSYVS